MNRFFLPPDCFSPELVRFDEDTSHQIKRVLRLKTGDEVIALDDCGLEYSVQLTRVGGAGVEGKILSSRQTTAEPKTQLTLLVGLTQREKFEWVLQKCTEIGAAAFTPVITSRSLVQDIRSAEQKTDRWHLILKEAAEQSGRGRIPALNPPVLYLQALEQLRNFDLGLVASEAEHKTTISGAIRRFRGDSLGILIGPEGGLTLDEIQRAQKAGIRSVSLGTRILRMETAAMVAAALILHGLKDLD